MNPSSTAPPSRAQTPARSLVLPGSEQSFGRFTQERPGLSADHVAELMRAVEEPPTKE